MPTPPLPPPVPAPGGVLSRRALRAMSDPDGVPVPLRELLGHARPAYGARTWPAALEVLSRDPSWRRVVADLVDQMRDGQRLRQPVRVQFRRGRQLLDGMHRIAAHVRAGAPTILASTRFPSAVPETVEVSATLTRTEPGGGDVDAVDLWEPLTSLPVGGDWANTDGLGMVGDVATAAWHLPHSRRHDLLEALDARARETGCVLTVHAVTLAGSDH